jgi:hypothetical protein
LILLKSIFVFFISNSDRAPGTSQIRLPQQIESRQEEIIVKWLSFGWIDSI